MIECNHYGYGPDCDDKQKTACDNFKKDYPNIVNCHFSNIDKNCKAE